MLVSVRADTRDDRPQGNGSSTLNHISIRTVHSVALGLLGLNDSLVANGLHCQPPRPTLSDSSDLSYLLFYLPNTDAISTFRYSTGYTPCNLENLCLPRKKFH